MVFLCLDVYLMLSNSEWWTIYLLGLNPQFLFTVLWLTAFYVTIAWLIVLLKVNLVVMYFVVLRLCILKNVLLPSYAHIPIQFIEVFLRGKELYYFNTHHSKHYDIDKLTSMKWTTSWSPLTYFIISWNSDFND